MKLYDGGIAHASTVVGGYLAENENIYKPTNDMPDPDVEDRGPGEGAMTYIVLAGEDGAVRFYDLKFRAEVRNIWAGRDNTKVSL